MHMYVYVHNKKRTSLNISHVKNITLVLKCACKFTSKSSDTPITQTPLVNTKIVFKLPLNDLHSVASLSRCLPIHIEPMPTELYSIGHIDSIVPVVVDSEMFSD